MSNHFYQELEFPSSNRRPFIACNMVTSLDGKVTADGTQPSSLGSSFDRRTMGMIRSHFDAVLAGGNTIRVHPHYLGVPKELEESRREKGLPAQPLTVVLSRSGNLEPGSSLFTKAPRPPIVITSPNGARNLASSIKEQAQVEVMESLDPCSIVSLLKEKYSVQRLLLEGGPSVNYQFMQAQLLDELFLTLHPSLIGRRDELGLSAGDQVLEKADSIQLISVHQVGNELFLRYRVSW